MRKILLKVRKIPKVCLTSSENENVSEDMIMERNYNIPDAFICCPNMGTMQFDIVTEQDKFISENEMSQMDESKALLLNKL